MKELTALLLGIIAIFVYMNFIRRTLYLDKIESSVNGNKYYVRNLPDRNEAADKLARIGNSLKSPSIESIVVSPVIVGLYTSSGSVILDNTVHSSS